MSRQKIAPTAKYALPPEWEQAVDGWTSWLVSGGKAERTVGLRRSQIRYIARLSRTARPRSIGEGTLEKICGAQVWSKEHRRSTRTALVSFFTWCLKNGLVDRNPADELPIVPNDTARPHPVSEAVWRALLDNATPRELLMARLAGEAGLRRAEVAQSRRDDLIDDRRGCSLIVHGKGNKQRVVPVSDALASAIRAHCDHGYLFPDGFGGHISPAWVGTMISRLMPPGSTMHGLRHFYACRVYRGSATSGPFRCYSGTPVLRRRSATPPWTTTRSALMRHSSLATTARYLGVTDERRVEAIERLDPLGGGRAGGDLEISRGG